MSSRGIVVGVAAHKAYPMPKDPCYLPIQVGAALRPDLDLGFQRDDEGDGISGLNASYCELTALYWLWRNCGASAKGLVHYRRHLASADPARRRGAESLARVAGGDELLALLEGVGAVLPKRRLYYVETMRSHWNYTQPSEQLAEAERVVADLEPSYSEALSECLSRRGAHMFNMLVARSDVFDGWCEWVFPVVEELCRRLPPEQYPPFQARYPGRITELLLDPWLEVNGVSFVELPTLSPEPVDWVAKGRGFLAAKFLGRKYERSF